MHRAVIAYGNARLEARQSNELWTVRLANLEARGRYLDLALAELLGNAPDAHRAAARLLSQLADVVEQQEGARASDRAPVQPRTRRPAARRRGRARPLVIGLRVLLFAIVSSTAFMLTTWLTTLR